MRLTRRSASLMLTQPRETHTEQQSVHQLQQSGPRQSRDELSTVPTAHRLQWSCRERQ